MKILNTLLLGTLACAATALTLPAAIPTNPPASDTEAEVVDTAYHSDHSAIITFAEQMIQAFEEADVACPSKYPLCTTSSLEPFDEGIDDAKEAGDLGSLIALLEDKREQMILIKERYYEWSEFRNALDTDEASGIDVDEGVVVDKFEVQAQDSKIADTVASSATTTLAIQAVTLTSSPTTFPTEEINSEDITFTCRETELLQIVDEAIARQDLTGQPFDLEIVSKTGQDDFTRLASQCLDNPVLQTDDKNQESRTYEWWDIGNLFDTSDPVVADSIQDVFKAIEVMKPNLQELQDIKARLRDLQARLDTRNIDDEIVLKGSLASSAEDVFDPEVSSDIDLSEADLAHKELAASIEAVDGEEKNGKGEKNEGSEKGEEALELWVEDGEGTVGEDANSEVMRTHVE